MDDDSDKDDTPRTPLVNEYVVARQHMHWAETSMASWIRTMIITFAAALAAKKVAKLPYILVILTMLCAWIGGAMSLAAYYRRTRARTKQHDTLEDMWKSIKEVEDEMAMQSLCIGSIFVVTFMLLLVAYCAGMQ